MITIEQNGIVIFGLKIYFYALIIITGAILAAWLATKEAKRRGLDPDMVWDVMPWLLIAGIIGARIWHVLTPSASILVDGKNPYFINPIQILNFRQGGLGIPGGIMAGALALWIYARKKKVNFTTWLDIVAPGVALAQGIGRWGNFFNKEIYGLPTKITQFPISVNINGQYYLATFFYEFVWNLLNMCLLLWLPRKLGEKMKPGDNFLVYVLFYAVGRFVLEFIRFEDSPILGININQLVMAVLGIASICLLVWRHIKKKEVNKELDEEPLENKE
jgi:phosphatidylglycerol---prolipoprotein diacylglyceryl transferase